MDLSDQLERQLTDSVLDFIGFDPSPQVVRGLMGSEALARMPSGLRGGYSYARWVVRYSLSCATPDRFVRVVQSCDPGEALVELHAADAARGAAPSTRARDRRAGMQGTFTVR